MRIILCLLTTALICSPSGFMQCIAWTSMFVQESCAQHEKNIPLSLNEALKRTFDEANKCDLCHAIDAHEEQDIRAIETKESLKNLPQHEAEEIDLPLTADWIMQQQQQSNNCCPPSWISELESPPPRLS